MFRIRSWLSFLAPWSPRGADWAHWLLSIALVAALMLAAFAGGYGIGFHNGEKYSAKFFEQRYADLGIPTQHLRTRFMLPTTTQVFPSILSVNFAHYPAAGDQGPQGSCAAFASAWVLSYDYRMAHVTTHPGIKFSPAWLYEHYVSAYNGGADAGSWPTQDLEEVPTLGVPQFHVYPAPQPLTAQFPPQSLIPAVYTNAGKYRIPVSVSTLYQGYASDAIFGEIQSVLSQGQPALLSVNVPPSFDNATVTHGLVSYPGPESSRGGHEIVAIAVDATKVMPDGSVGAVEVQNQWTRAWGINGRAWLSRLWLANEAWAVVEENVAPNSPGAHFFKPPKGAADGERAITPPPPFLVHPHPTSGKHPNAIRPVYAKDRPGYDLSKPINWAARHYHLSAPGLLSVLMTECGLYTTSTRCDRVVPPYDVSFGDAQIIVSTAAAFGVGNGNFDGYYGSNVTTVRNFENDPARGINLAAKVLVQDRKITGANFPRLHLAFNCGPGDMNPAYGSECWQNNQAYLQWWAIAQQYQR